MRTEHFLWARSVQSQKFPFNGLTRFAMQNIGWEKAETTLYSDLFCCKEVRSRKHATDQKRSSNYESMSQLPSKERSVSVQFWRPDEETFKNYISGCFWFWTKLCMKWKPVKIVVAPRGTTFILLFARGRDSNSRHLCNFLNWPYACALAGYMNTSHGMLFQLPLQFFSDLPLNALRLQRTNSIQRYLETRFRAHQRFLKRFVASVRGERIETRPFQSRM